MVHALILFIDNHAVVQVKDNGACIYTIIYTCRTLGGIANIASMTQTVKFRISDILWNSKIDFMQKASSFYIS